MVSGATGRIAVCDAALYAIAQLGERADHIEALADTAPCLGVCFAHNLGEDERREGPFLRRGGEDDKASSALAVRVEVLEPLEGTAVEVRSLLKRTLLTELH